MSSDLPAPSREGKIDFPYGGETYQTYYKLYGDMENRSRNPLIVLHGGPGLVHNYLTVHSDLAVKYNIPVLFYDQIGNGKSTHLQGKAREFWSIELFVEELHNVIKFFDIQDGFDILGHSWGGILASEYDVRKRLPGLKHLILADSLAAYSLWQESNAKLLQSFPQHVRDGIMGRMADMQKFYAAVKELHAVHGCIVKPVPQELQYSMDQIFGPDGDPTVANANILLGWSIIDRLHLVQAKTFVINGRKDLAQDFVVKPFFDNIQRVKWITLENSSHTPFFEERDRYMELVENFLTL